MLVLVAVIGAFYTIMSPCHNADIGPDTMPVLVFRYYNKINMVWFRQTKNKDRKSYDSWKIIVISTIVVWTSSAESSRVVILYIFTVCCTFMLRVSVCIVLVLWSSLLCTNMSFLLMYSKPDLHDETWAGTCMFPLQAKDARLQLYNCVHHFCLSACHYRKQFQTIFQICLCFLGKKAQEKD